MCFNAAVIEFLYCGDGPVVCAMAYYNISLSKRGALVSLYIESYDWIKILDMLEKTDFARLTYFVFCERTVNIAVSAIKNQFLIF